MKGLRQRLLICTLSLCCRTTQDRFRFKLPLAVKLKSLLQLLSIFAKSCREHTNVRHHQHDKTCGGFIEKNIFYISCTNMK